MRQVRRAERQGFWTAERITNRTSYGQLAQVLSDVVEQVEGVTIEHHSKSSGLP